MSSDWQVVTQLHDKLGENALWHPIERAVYWIDWYGAILHRYTPARDAAETWKIHGIEAMGAAVFARSGRLLLGSDKGLVLFDPALQSVTPFADPLKGVTGIGFNDGKVDHAGRLWVGTFEASEKEPRAAFYRVTGKGQCTTGDDGFIVCNGPAFSPDNRTLYFSDTMGRKILAYDIDSTTGVLSGKRVFAMLEEGDGLPDGLTVDSAGDLWCAHYSAAKVSRFKPDGSRAEEITLPVPFVTSCCFGGDDLKTLYVTTGWSNPLATSIDRADLGGALFARRVATPGLPEPIFSPEGNS
jgi:sugar lactone lactonase YvrE